MILKLNYFDLISPHPIPIRDVGSIISPTLKDISRIGIETYNYFLYLLSIDIRTYFIMNGQLIQYETMSEEDINKLNLFDLIVSNVQFTNIFKMSLDFFIKETVTFNEKIKCFVIQKNTDKTSENINGNIIGVITKNNYLQVCNIIQMRNNIQSKNQEDLSTVKSKKALEIMKKLQLGRTKKTQQAKADKNMDLGNILSAVANRHPSLNMINIWDLTIYQLWDAFSRLANNNIYDIQAMSVAAWGDKDKHFDIASWYKKINL